MSQRVAAGPILILKPAELDGKESDGAADRGAQAAASEAGWVRLCLATHDPVPGRQRAGVYFALVGPQGSRPGSTTPDCARPKTCIVWGRRQSRRFSAWLGFAEIKNILRGKSSALPLTAQANLAARPLAAARPNI
jgi:hypothetical protein